MHLPDGFISPQVYLPAWAGAAAAAWAVLRRRRALRLDPATIPRLAVTTAGAFVLSLVTVPLPGGTSVHPTFAGLLTVLFGFRTAFLCLTLVLGMQAALLGDGGITVLPLNVLLIAGAGCGAAALADRALRRRHRDAGLFAAGWTAVVVPALLIALLLGAQSHLARDAAGTPRYFPLGWRVTLVALVPAHMLLGVVEGLLAVLGWRFLRPRDPANGGGRG